MPFRLAGHSIPLNRIEGVVFAAFLTSHLPLIPITPLCAVCSAFSIDGAISSSHGSDMTSCKAMRNLKRGKIGGEELVEIESVGSMSSVTEQHNGYG